MNYLDKLKRLEQSEPKVRPVAPTCFNCGAIATLTHDINGRPVWECKACAVGADTSQLNGIVGDGGDVGDRIFSEGELIAVLICSKILEAHVWFAFDDNFNPGTGQVVFSASEMPHLATMSGKELRKEYERKLALHGGWIRDRIESTKH